MFLGNITATGLQPVSCHCNEDMLLGYIFGNTFCLYIFNLAVQYPLLVATALINDVMVLFRLLTAPDGGLVICICSQVT